MKECIRAVNIYKSFNLKHFNLQNIKQSYILINNDILIFMNDTYKNKFINEKCGVIFITPKCTLEELHQISKHLNYTIIDTELFLRTLKHMVFL
jgi:hypothetical protein